jgi:hypothetical protein
MRIEDIFTTIDLSEAKQTWQKHKNPRAGGMSKKAVKSYRRSNPGSKIQTAVTTKPSKLKKGSKASKRRLSFCRRMRGMKKKRTSAKTARDPNSAINKSLRRWNCESVQDMRELVMIAEQRILVLRENREQGVAEAGYNPLDDERREQRRMDQERAQFKRDELEAELGGEEQRYRDIMSGTWYILIDGRPWRRQGQPVTFQGRAAARRAGQTIKNRAPEKTVTITMNPGVLDETKDRSPGKITKSEDPCWSGYHMVGTKKKGGREVPNCVPGKKGD